jgi:hypothetical protein
MTAETDVQNLLRVRYSQHGWRLWRNNNGALQDSTGRWVRYGLGNDSKAAAAQHASADLIGVAPVLILPEHVGTIIGVFASVECKASHGQVRIPQAQRNWQTLVRSLGGYAIITDGEREL